MALWGVESSGLSASTILSPVFFYFDTGHLWVRFYLRMYLQNIRPLRTLFGLGVGAVLCFSVEASDIIMTYGSPGATDSTVANSSVFNFDNLTLGVQNNVVWSGVGTYDSLSITAANQYGGAADAAYPNGSPYAVQSTSASLGGVSSTTLSLNASAAYFGMWWSAGDAPNTLTFYSGGNQIAQFTVANLMSALPGTYLGNPTPGPNFGNDSSEPFAFINFYGYDGTTFDKIVVSNNSSSGFEYDNDTVRNGAYGTDPSDLSTLPGVPVEYIVNNGAAIVYGPGTPPIPVPEPPTVSLLGLAGVVGLMKLGRSQRGQTSL